MISGTQFGITRAYALKQEEYRLAHKVQNLLIDQIMDHPLGSPEYYVTLYYGKSFNGGQLDSEEYRKRWDREEIKKTHKFIKNLIHKSFGELVPVWFTIERHRDSEDELGKIKKGSFHTNLFVGPIPDDALLNPSPRLMPLFYQSDASGIPINMRNTSMECKKQLLLEATIRQAKWVGKHPDAVVISSPPEQEMADNVLSYGLKDLTTLDELEKVIDWKNSSFYKPSK